LGDIIFIVKQSVLKTVLSMVFLSVILFFPYSKNVFAYTTDEVFVDFNSEFVPGTNDRCSKANSGFISICGQVRQTAILSSTIAGDDTKHTNRPVKNATINVYLGADGTTTGKKEGKLTERLEQAVTNADGIFNLGIPQGVGVDGKVYVAVICGRALKDLYALDTSSDFVNFDIAVPCGTDAGQPVPAPEDLTHASREGFLSCKEEEFGVGYSESAGTTIDVPLIDPNADPKYLGSYNYPVSQTEEASEPLIGKFAQDTLFALQDIPSLIYSVVGSVYSVVSSPKHEDFGSEDAPLASCQDILCCFQGISTGGICGNKNMQTCGNIGTGLMDPYESKEVCSPARTDRSKTICVDGGADVSLDEFISRYNVYPTWFCRGPNSSAKVEVDSEAVNDSYDSNYIEPFEQKIFSILPKENTEQFSLPKGINITSTNFDDSIAPPIAYISQPFTKIQGIDSAGNINPDLEFPKEGSYYRLGLAETLCGCVQTEGVYGKCLGSGTNQGPANISLFRIEGEADTDAGGYAYVPPGSTLTNFFGVDVARFFIGAVDHVLSVFQPPYDGEESGPCAPMIEIEIPDPPGPPIIVEVPGPYICEGDIKDTLETKITVAKSPGAEVAVGLRQMMAAFQPPFTEIPAMGGGYTIDVEATNEDGQDVGKGKDVFLDYGLNGAVNYADRLRQFVSEPVVSKNASLNEPTFYIGGGGPPVPPGEIDCDLNAPDVNIAGLISKEAFGQLADRWINNQNFADECYNDTVRRAVAKGVNPAYLLFVWLGESGASNFSGNYQDFGINLASVVGFNAQIERSLITLTGTPHNFCATNGIPPWPSKLYGHFACYIAGDRNQSGSDYQRLKARIEAFYETFVTVLWPTIAPGCPLSTGPTDNTCP